MGYDGVPIREKKVGIRPSVWGIQRNRHPELFEKRWLNTYQTTFGEEMLCFAYHRYHEKMDSNSS